MHIFHTVFYTPKVLTRGISLVKRSLSCKDSESDPSIVVTEIHQAFSKGEIMSGMEPKFNTQTRYYFSWLRKN